MSQAEPHSVEAYTGESVAVEPVRELSGGGTRIELDVDGGPRWRVDVTTTGSVDEVVTSWDSRDGLADVEVPEWIDDVLARLHRG